MGIRASAVVIKRCREIIMEIDKAIPSRGYVKPVQEAFEKNGLEVPKRRKIVAVRNGTEYDLSIAKALREISQDVDENDELIKPPKWEVNSQTNLKLTVHRSKGKKKIPA